MNDILSSAFRLYARYFGVILGLVLTIGLPCQALSSYVAYEVFGRKNFFPALQTSLVIELVFGIVMTGGILQALFADRIGRRATFLECLSVGVSHWFQLCWTNFLMIGLILMSAILFFLPIESWPLRLFCLAPALFLALRLSLAIIVVIAEGEWGAAALRRSIRLTADKTWQIIGLFLLIFLPIQLVSLIGVGMLQTKPAFDNWEVTTILGTIFKLISSLIPICFFCLYEKTIAEDRPVD